MKTQRIAPLALLVLVLAITISAFGAGAAPPAGNPGLARAMAAQEAHSDALMARAGVVGTAVGLDANDQPVVKIYTRAHTVVGLPAFLNGVPTDVEVTGDIVAQTAPIGTSTGNARLIIYRNKYYCTVGTLGARVKDSAGNVYALSNAHVFALEGSKTDGGVVAGPDGDRILHPGRVDLSAQVCGSQAEIDAAVIGTLWRFVPIIMNRNGNNSMDAAIAKVLPGTVGTATPQPGYGTPTASVVTAKLKDMVQKYGRTTAWTKGTVSGVNAKVVVSYDNGQAGFVGQIVIKGTGGSFSSGGDSGSLIVTDPGNAPVALLFAGSSTTTIGNPIGAVLSEFGVSIDTAP